MKCEMQVKARRRLQIPVACVVCAAAAVFPQATRQRRAEQQPTFRVASNLVLVDVTVRDKKGDLVKDLRKDEFTVYEDNAPQEIVTFSLENIPVALPENVAGEEKPKAPAVNFSATPEPAKKKEELKDKRLILLFFDLSSLPTEDLIRAVTTAEDFVLKKSTPHDLIAIATYSTTLQLVQDLTNDREVLLKTLKQINPTEAGDAPAEDLGDPSTSEDVFVPDDVQFNVFNTDRSLSAVETLAKTYRAYP